MSRGPRPEYLCYENIKDYADSFLDEHHRDRAIPIPIEEIIESQLGIDIIPVPGISNTRGVDGFLYCDLSAIVVDQDKMVTRYFRHRFTLAHEVGHLTIHRPIFESLKCDSEAEWVEFQDSLSSTEMTWLERQADNFAGLVLVPPTQLVDKIKTCINKLQAEGGEYLRESDFAWDLVETCLSKIFQVSKQVVHIRPDKDGVRNHFNIL